MTHNLLPGKPKHHPCSIRYSRSVLSQRDEITVFVPHWAWTEALYRARKERPQLFEEDKEIGLKTLAIVLLYLDEMMFTS